MTNTDAQKLVQGLRHVIHGVHQAWVVDLCREAATTITALEAERDELKAQHHTINAAFDLFKVPKANWTDQRVGLLAAERNALEATNKELRALLSEADAVAHDACTDNCVGCMVTAGLLAKALTTDTEKSQ